MSLPARTRSVIDVLVWMVVIWVVIFWRLGYLSLLDPDEAHYAQLTREMIRGHHWMVPRLQGVPFIDKPVLYHWLQAAAEWAFGESEFALRLPSAAGAVALLGTVRWAGRSLFDATVGRRAALMFATTPLTFALASLGVFDMLYTAFLFGAVASLLVAASARRPRVEVVGWVLLAFAVMVNGPVALLLVLMYGIVLMVVPSTRDVARRLHWGRGGCLVAALAAPWFVFMAVTYRDQFVRDYVLAGNLWYFTRPAVFSTRASDPLFYARTYFGAGFPWSVLALGVGIDALRRRARPHTAAVLWVWTLLVIGFFSVAGFKLDTYIFPAMPTTCLLVAIGVSPGRDAPHLRATGVAVWISCVALLIGGVVLAMTMFRIDLGLSMLALGLPVSLIVGGVAGIIGWRRGGPSAVVPVWVATLLAVYAVVVVEGFPVLERSRPTAPIGRWVNRHIPAGVPVGVYGLDDWRSSLRFYAQRPLHIVHDQREIAKYFTDHPDGYVLMLRSDAAGFRANGFPLHLVGGRRAIVGRRGRYVRKQVWGRLVITAPGVGALVADAGDDPDVPD